MNANKLERAVGLILQEVKNCIKHNLTSTNVDGHQITLALASVDQGFDRSHKLLQQVESTNLSFQPPVAIPDNMFDIIAMFCGQNVKKSIAAFTITRNEPYFLPLWCSYYSGVVGEENLYVLDNSTTDDSINTIRQRWPLANIIHVDNDEAFNWNWTTEVVKTFQRAALRAYKAIIFSDTDEFLMPKHTTLQTFVQQFLHSDILYVRATGFGVIQNVDSEPCMNQQHPLKQRATMWRAPMYDKTLLTKVPLNWSKGCHAIYVDSKKLVDDPRSDELCLVHLRDVDVQMLYQRCLDRSKMKAASGSSFHGSTDVEEIKTYFRTRLMPWNPLSESEFLDEKRSVPTEWVQLLSMK